ncbi:peptidylprolyl isomerase [Cohnella caldifontis]|uniref:peptidylprolyl isomerase n=1 Tax=Cohnella caldifontis TaxID=3027471 RepID=UPI0023ECCDA6|nr:peptidylprolyl isomerase [Cohnella sp. YIM B05605]
MEIRESVAFVLNGQPVTLGEVLKLSKIERSFPALDNKRRMVLIEQLAADRGAACTFDELQQGVNRYRKELGLYSSEETKRWLDDNGLSLEDLADAVKPRILREKLVAGIPSDRVKAYFAGHRRQFDAARLSRIVASDAGTARELKFRLREGADFGLLAREFSIEEETRYAYGYVGIVGRTEMSPEESSAVFGAADGDIVGVLTTPRGYELIRIERILRAVMDDKTENRIRSLLFEEMLETFEADAVTEMTIWKRT